MPERARWEHLRDELHHNVGDGLNKALRRAGGTQPRAGGRGPAHRLHPQGRPVVDLGQEAAGPHRALLQVPAAKEDFEFPDLLGAAYEYLIGEFADSAGKKGGEFYTPRVGGADDGAELVEPQRRHDASTTRARLGRHADPVQGLRRGDTAATRATLHLAGQENNGSVWSISKMNLLLHGIPDADMRERRRHSGRPAAHPGRQS